MLIKKNKFKASSQQEEILFEDSSIYAAEAEMNGSPIDEDKVLNDIYAVQQRLADLENEFEAKKRDAEIEVRHIVNSAREVSEKIIQEAENVKTKANEEIASERQELQKEKNALGALRDKELKNAYELGMKQASEVVGEWINMLTTFHHIKRDTIVNSKKEIISIAFDLAKQIIGHEVKTNEEFLLNQVERSITKVANTKGLIQIIINPEEISKTNSIEIALAKLLDPSVKLIFQKDEKIEKGSCVINTQGGRFDSSFNTQIRILKEALEKYLGYTIEDLPETIAEENTDNSEVSEQDNSRIKLQLQKLKILDNNTIVKGNELEDEDMAVLELQDSKELGANDFDEKEIRLSDEDDDFEEDEDLEEDLDDEDEDEDEDEELLDEEEDEEEDDDFDDDDEEEDEEEDLGDDEEEKDGRFPEY